MVWTPGSNKILDSLKQAQFLVWLKDFNMNSVMVAS